MKSFGKILMAGLCALFVAGTAMAADVKWQTNLDEAIKTAAKEKKVVLALFTGSDWCPYCVKLDKELISHKEFSDFANSEVIPVFIDFPRKTKLQPGQAKMNDQWMEKYKVEGFPTIVFIDGKGKSIGTAGYSGGDAASYIKEFKTIIKKK